MSLPSQEILNEIKDLIIEITGFQEEEENFVICERYCISHVVHHTYPFVNKTTVKSLVNGYISRFYGHGYFKVSQELNHQVKSFLSNEKLFEKNPQYDIQWCLLSLISSLSSNLTLVKEIPELLPIDDEENETEDFDWKEYLMNDLPRQISPTFSSDNEEPSSDDNEDEDDIDEIRSNDQSCSEYSVGSATKSINDELCQDKQKLEILYDNKILFNTESSSEIRRQRIEEFLKSRRSKRDLENDFKLRGNITEKFDSLMSQEGIIRKTQLISELEMMENILFQFQTGERIFLRKGLVNPALTSLTQDTVCSYLESLQPYFRIIRCFKDFDAEVTSARYPEKCQEKGFNSLKKCQSSSTITSVTSQKRKISNVLYMYNVILRKALEPFENTVIEIVENLGNHTLIQVEHKLKPYYSDLTSLFYVHNMGTKNWKTDCNWMTSVRILSVLYNAIMDTTSKEMSFLYLNFFLHCFQVYLDIIDTWISFADLIDPNDEFIITKSDGMQKSENKCLEYEIRPYKIEIENLGMKKVLVLDFISEKMIHVGQSLEVLKRLNRFVTQKTETSKKTFYYLLVKTINEKVRTLGKVECIPKKHRPPEKQKSIFTVRNLNLQLERDQGGGDSSQIGNLLMEIIEEDKEKSIEKNQCAPVETADKNYNYCEDLINSVVRNSFFKMAFKSLGVKQVEKQLEEAKARQNQDFGDGALVVVQKTEEKKSGIYPLHKIITEAFYSILENRISDACGLVKNIVLNECNLLVHLSLLRSILLFNDSYFIQPFILALFTQPVIWGSSYSLSFHLKECVRVFYKDYANGLSVTLTKNGPTSCDNILQVIDVITVNYEVKWPLTLIITPEAMKKYNEIFRLALKLKWAHWVLCGLHFQNGKDEDEKLPKSICHRLRLLRFWLLSALGRINNYLMAQMTASDLELSSCNDLKDIIQEHSKFLKKIYCNCLLENKSPEGRKLIVDTLIPLCLDLLLAGQHRITGFLNDLYKLEGFTMIVEKRMESFSAYREEAMKLSQRWRRDFNKIAKPNYQRKALGSFYYELRTSRIIRKGASSSRAVPVAFISSCSNRL